VAGKRREYGDFLVLTRQRPRLRIFAEAFDQLEIPVEVSGAGLFCKSEEVKALALVLSALADPLDSVSLVGVLRGPLFGLSDPELFQFRQAGGRFELSVPLPEAKDSSEAAALDKRYGRCSRRCGSCTACGAPREVAARGSRGGILERPAGWRWRPRHPAERGGSF
jgi:hypothetical protein